jgi:hypothetical protein
MINFTNISMPDSDQIYRDRQQFNSNNKEISVITGNLEAHDKNPNFYRNKKIIAIAAAIFALIAVAAITYLSYGIALPAFLAAIGTGHASGMAIGGTLIFPPMAAVAGISGVQYLYRTFDSDSQKRETLQAQNKVIKDRIDAKIELCKQHIQWCNEALSEEFSEAAWDALKKISTPTGVARLDKFDESDRRTVLLYNLTAIESYKTTVEAVAQATRSAWYCS